MAKYLKANPQTQFVQMGERLDEQATANWQPGKYVLAVYESEEAVKKIKTTQSVCPADYA